MTEQNNQGNNQGGGDPSAFIQTLSEDLRTNEAFKEIDSADKLAGMYLDLSKSHGELQTQFNGLPKAPESPDKYSVVEIPEGVQVDEAVSNEFRKLAHEVGMSDETYSKVLSFHYASIAQQAEAIKTARDNMLADLKTEWKDDFDGNIDLAKKVAANEQLGLGALLSEPDSTGDGFILANNPAFVKALVTIGKAISVDRLADNGSLPGKGDQPRTPDGRPMIKYKDMPAASQE